MRDFGDIKMNGQITVVGFKSFKGVIESQSHDFTKLIVLVGFPRKNELQGGFDAQVAQDLTGNANSENSVNWKGKKFPLTIEADYELTTKGLEVYEYKIVSPVASTPVSPAPAPKQG
jgi:hypothetical protein